MSNYKLYKGNSYELIKNIPDKSVDLIVTDPPYLIENVTSGSKTELARSIQKMNNELSAGVLTEGINTEILDEFVRVLKKINIYIWCNHKQIPMYLDYFVTKLGCKFDVLIWNKTNATPLFNNKYLTDKEYCLYFRRGGTAALHAMRKLKQYFISLLMQRIKLYINILLLSRSILLKRL